MLATAFFAVACGAPSRVSDTQPITGEDPPAQYRHVVLDNGLEVLLVSRPGSDRAAASMAVGVGSADDPPGREGMAHFLEHMLFLGTDRYPQVDDYQKFLTAHGGHFNAYTAFEHTNYFFSVHNAHLEGALARFSRFFIAPLMDARYVQREREAVDAEYHAWLEEDTRGLLDVFKVHVNAEHPYAKFHVGNLDTLRSAGLRQEVLDFYARHYGVAKMKLSISGGQSLETLHVLAARYFSEIADSVNPRQDISAPLFHKEQLGRRVTIKPNREERSLLAVFPVSDMYPHYRSKPLSYIAHLLGHEGEGSLLSLLKHRAWASALSAGSGLRYRGGATSDVNILLSEEGLRHVDEVVRLLFDYIALIRSNGVEAWRFRELQALEELRFRYREFGDPLSHVTELSVHMHQFPVRDLLRGPYMFSEFKPELIHSELDHFRPDNMLLLVRNPLLQDATDASPWYQVPYRSEPFHPETLEAWRSPASQTAHLALPKANPFIPQNTEIYPLDEHLRVGADEPVPLLVNTHPRLRIWHLQDHRFALPYADIFVRMNFDGYRDTAEHKALARLWVAVVEDMLNEYLYPAYLAGVRVSLRALFWGIELRISGFNDRQQQVLADIVEKIRAFNPDLERVRQIQARLVRDLSNAVTRAPYQVLHRRMNQLLSGGDTEHNLAEAMKRLDSQSLMKYAHTMLARLHIQALMHGNISAEQSTALGAYLHPLVDAGVASELQRSVVHLPRNQTSVWLEDLPHNDTALVLYLQAEDDTPRTRIMVALSQQIFEADFFRELRTERQLGYAVFMSPSVLMDLAGLSWTIQSPDKSAKLLEQEIRAFMERSLGYAERLSPEDFAKHRESVIKTLNEQPKTLSSATEHWWKDTARPHVGFDTKQQLLKAAHTIDRGQWIAFYKNWLSSSARRELLLYAPGSAATPVVSADARRLYRQMGVFRRDMSTHTLVQTIY